MENIKEIIAKNLVSLRKNQRLTQQELAQKLNYSDKAVSRWEHAETLPDIETLCRICEIYGVKFEYLLQAEQPPKAKNPYIVRRNTGNRIIIAALAIVSIWLLVSVLFIYNETFGGVNLWTLFIWALPASGLTASLFNRMWGNRRFNVYLGSFNCWTLILSVYLQLLTYNIWMLFIVGVPIQIIIILSSMLKKD